MTTPGPAELSAKVFDELTGQLNNRRQRERRDYRTLQWVAPCTEEGLPDRRSYRQVKCHDISRGGLSYFTDRPPLDEFLVVALGKGPETIYLKCKVSNCVRVDERDGAFRIGCEFIERLELPPANRPGSTEAAKSPAQADPLVAAAGRRK